MAAPFDDQGVIDLPETMTYASLAGSTASWTDATLDDQGVQTVISGTLELTARDVLVTKSITGQTTRPQEGGTLTDSSGTVYRIVSVLRRKLGYFWEIAARTFAVPGGLNQTGTLQRRDSSTTTTKGLSNPTWANLELAVACKLIRGGQSVLMTGESPVEMDGLAQVVLEGYREIRTGDRFVLSTESSSPYDVDGAEPYDASFGAQVLNLRRSV